MTGPVTTANVPATLKPVTITKPMTHAKDAPVHKAAVASAAKTAANCSYR